VPIYQTATYKYESFGKFKGYEYSRSANPTRTALESAAAELERGSRGFAFASGMAAVNAVFSLLKSGDKILTSPTVYGGTFRLIESIFKNFGIGYIFADMSDAAAVEKAITPEVKAIFLETPSNPLLFVSPLEKIAAVAKERGIITIADNTFMTPYLQRPLELGIDISLHSATKYLGGHSDVVAGLVIVKDPVLAEQIAFVQNSAGAVLHAFDSFLLIRGIKTLALRMDRHTENAQKAAEFLSAHSLVKEVHYPGLKNFPHYAMNAAQAKNGGAMLSFEVAENVCVKKFLSSLEMVILAESLGGVESLVCHPDTMTHASMPPEIRAAAGITQNLVRMSVGVENADDIISDLNSALEIAKK
jgi:cystathionine beta-lyase